MSSLPADARASDQREEEIEQALSFPHAFGGYEGPVVVAKDAPPSPDGVISGRVEPEGLVDHQ